MDDLSERLLERAVTASALGRHAIAIQACLDILAVDPEHRWALRVLCQERWYADDPAGALQQAREALSIYPEDSYLLMIVGCLSYETDERLQALQQAITLDGTDPRVLTELAILLFPTDPQTSQQLIERALQLNPDDASVWSGVARWHLAHLDVVKAIESARRAVALSPTTLLPRAMLLRALSTLRATAMEAAQLARESLALFPESEVLLASYIQQCISLGWFDEALEAVGSMTWQDCKPGELRSALYRLEDDRPRIPTTWSVSQDIIGQAGPWDSCAHSNVRLINPYETIRKFFCPDCDGIMMCQCEEDFGRLHLAHQLRRASGWNGQPGGDVSAGFQRAICATCRGRSEKAAPMAHGSLIARYYWREITMEVERRYHTQRALPNGTYRLLPLAEREALHKSIQRDVTSEFRALHRSSPKYVIEPASSRPRTVQRSKKEKT